MGRFSKIDPTEDPWGAAIQEKRAETLRTLDWQQLAGMLD